MSLLVLVLLPEVESFEGVGVNDGQRPERQRHTHGQRREEHWVATQAGPRRHLRLYSVSV